MTSLLWGRLKNGHFLFRLQYNCPVFPSNNQDRQRSGQRFFGILILFCGDDLLCHLELSHGRLANIWLTGEHSDPIGTFRTQAYGLLKKGPRPWKRFLVAPASIALRFLCTRPPLLLKRAQPKPPCDAGYGLGGEGKSKWVEKMAHRKVFGPLSRPFRLSLAPQQVSAPLGLRGWVVVCFQWEWICYLVVDINKFP